MEMSIMLLAAAGVGGVGLAALAVIAARRYSRATPAAAPPVPLELVPEEGEPLASFTPPRAPPAPAPAAFNPPIAPPRAPPPATARSHPERAPAMVLTHGVSLHDEAYERRMRSAPAPAPPRARPPPPKSWAQEALERTPPAVETEWARRQVGPVEPGRTAGVCGGCAARLSVSNTRPLRIACPVCGRTKLLAA